ncbi:MAG: NAD-dependent epimerase/dehydratase family protein [Crocinitomicaceae bacterium]
MNFDQTILNKIKTSAILITGGAGFIGSNLAGKLLNLKAKKVVIFDDLSTGFTNNIEEFRSHENFEFIEGSITDLQACLKVSKNVDIVFHMAALGSVPRSIDNPIATNNVNVDGFVNMLWAAKENAVKKIVYSSSSSVYGDDKTIPKTENNIGNPLSPYAVSKRSNELYANTFSDIYNMSITGLRYFNVFGPKQNVKGAYAAVIPIFISKLLKNEQCQINGDGKISRDFTYVDNVVYANILAAFKSDNKKHELLNIAMGDQLSLNDLYYKLEEKISSGLSPIHKPARLGDIQNSRADITKARQIIGYVPQVSVETGIEKTVNWYQSKN